MEAFSLHPGELVAVGGARGIRQGTPFARALGRMVEVPARALFIDGVDVTDRALHDSAALVALVAPGGLSGFPPPWPTTLRYRAIQTPTWSGWNSVGAGKRAWKGDIRGFRTAIRLW